jgi:lipid-binding SYLF domain-containing protein
MIKRLFPAMLALIAGVAVAITPLAAQTGKAEDLARAKERIKDAALVIDEIMAAGDKGIPRSIMERAEGIAVFPSLLKGGLVVGAQFGRGIISARSPQTPGGWSDPAFLTIAGGSFGAQIGAQAIDLILVVQNRRGLEQLVQNQFKVGADAAVAAGPIGRDASAATDIQMRAQILSYSRSRGLFAGITLNGTTIREDGDANGRLYGTSYTTRQILFDGMGGAPDTVGAWTATLKKYAK